MSLIEAHKLSRRNLLKSTVALALSSCAPYQTEVDPTQGGTRGLRADPNPRTEPLRIATETTAPLNKPKEKLSPEIIIPVITYTSDFRGSEPYRVHNIKAGSNAINNYFWEFDGSVNDKGELNKAGKNFIAPDESFALGPVIVKGEYVKGFAIGRNLQPEEVDGGGICQISTTLNVLALKSGLHIEQRKNHDYYNGWYFGNPNDPKEFGMDATIFIPGQDWVITNTYSYPLRFFLKEKDQRLIAELHGPSDMTLLNVELDGPYMEWPYKGKHVSEAGRFVNACRTVLTQRVYVPGNGSMKALLFEDTFWSNYQTSPHG